MSRRSVRSWQFLVSFLDVYMRVGCHQKFGTLSPSLANWIPASSSISMHGTVGCFLWSYLLTNGLLKPIRSKRLSPSKNSAALSFKQEGCKVIQGKARPRVRKDGTDVTKRVRTNLTSYYCLVPKLIRELLNKCLQLQQTGKKSSRVEGLSSAFAS